MEQKTNNNRLNRIVVHVCTYNRIVLYMYLEELLLTVCDTTHKLGVNPSQVAVLGVATGLHVCSHGAQQGGRCPM